MKNKIIVWLIVFSPLSLFGQKVDSLVQVIRSEYNYIVKNKESYKKTILYIDHTQEVTYNEDGSVESVPETETEEKITCYADQNNQIKLITCYRGFSHHHAMSGTLTEYYLKDGNLFFIFHQTKYVGHEVFDDKGKFIELKDRHTEASEQRIYTTGDNEEFFVSKDNCIRNLSKSANGKFSEINELLRKTANVEKNCSDSDTFYSVKHPVNILFGRTDGLFDEIISDKSTVNYSMFETLFGK